MRLYRYASAVILFILLLFLIDHFFLRISFNKSTSTVIEDSQGNLLGAKISRDGQWRFPYNKDVPVKFEKAIVEYEDRYFYKHPGVNPGALYRAIKQNRKYGKIVSGGSTLTMQTVRLARRKDRTYFQKVIEMILAIRLEMFNSKKEILALYASNAPFGSNVVGLDAASWRYFGRDAHKLSWSEAATLAVLPNAPSMIHPGRNRETLLKKRNSLLLRLLKHHVIDSVTYDLSLLEPLIEKPLALPQEAPHLLDRVHEKRAGQNVRTTIDRRLQERVNTILERHYQVLAANQIYNSAVIVIANNENKILAYIGNTKDESFEHCNNVDVIRAPRSTGSILKPFLFAGMMNDGQILPTTLIPDVPTQISGYEPENYDLSYDGAVPAKRALARSLNIPAVRLLQDFSVPKFYTHLKKIGLTTLKYSADHYGLTLILGGAEGTLWDITSAYSSMARVLNHYYQNDGNYFLHDFDKPTFFMDEIKKEQTLGKPIIYAAANWITFESLIEVNRPEEEANWRDFASKDRIAWKTGTSYGFRDGWAVGTTPEYTVGVWVGNATGEGRPGLTGIGTAAPILFEVFNILPRSSWFHQPVEEMIKIPVCKQSGYRMGALCEESDSIWVPEPCLYTIACPYHQMVHLSSDGQYRVNSQCEGTATMIHKKWFVLPPVMEWYYKSKNPMYRVLPAYKKGCGENDDLPMDIIYPRELTKVYIPKGIEGTRQEVIFEVAHRKPESTIFWHLDGIYIGSTRNFHKLGLAPSNGTHMLILVDEDGKTITRRFVVLNK